MPTILTPAEIDAHERLGTWRYVLGRIEATYHCPSFAAAGRLVAAVAEAADEAGHHPDLDVRYPDVVHVALTTHAAGAATTELDVAMAITISELAAAAGARSEPTSAQGYEIAVDAVDRSATASTST